MLHKTCNTNSAIKFESSKYKDCLFHSIEVVISGRKNKIVHRNKQFIIILAMRDKQKNREIEDVNILFSMLLTMVHSNYN